MTGTWKLAAIGAIALALGSAAAIGDPIKIEALMAERQHMKLDFADGSRRYVMLMQREGASSGDQLLAGAKVVEFGLHDVTPNGATDTIFYHAFTLPNGDTAYIKSAFRGVTVRGPDGKPRNALNGLWEVVGASGQLKGLKGAGTVRLKRVSKEARQFTFEGEASLPGGGPPAN